MANYGKELRMEGDIRKKGKVESAMEFVEKMKKVHKEAAATLKKMQEEIKRYADRVTLSTKDLVFKERPTQKLMERYMGLYVVEKVVSSNC